MVHIVFVWREVLISDGKRCSNGLKDTIRYLLYSLSNIQNLNKNNLLVASEFRDLSFEGKTGLEETPKSMSPKQVQTCWLGVSEKARQVKFKNGVE